MSVSKQWDRDPLKVRISAMGVLGWVIVVVIVVVVASVAFVVIRRRRRGGRVIAAKEKG
jgi:cytochrome c-type biogenesis protein CcmH/NrfF